MVRFSEKKLSYDTQDIILKDFCAVLIGMKSEDAIFRFLKDLLNRKERLMLVRRLQVAFLLNQGMSYDDIKKNLKVGKATIARISRWLEFGRGGYKDAIEKLSKRIMSSRLIKYYSK